MISRKEAMQAAPWILFGVTLLLFSVLVRGFWDFSNATNVLTRISFVAIPAMGLAIIMLAGAFDLSFVGVIGVAAVGTIVMTEAGVPVPVAVLVMLLLSVVAELINALFIVGLGIHPWLTTIASMLTLLGLEKALSGGYNLPLKVPSFQYIRFGNILGVPIIVYILIIVVALVVVLMHATPVGARLYSVGGNYDAARKVGIPADFYRYLSYGIMGVLCWVTAMLYLAQLSGYATESAYHNQLDVILAVFFGMAISRRNVKNVPGAVIGAAYVAFLANGLGLAGVSAYWIKLIEGCLVIAVVLGNSMGRNEIVQLD